MTPNERVRVVRDDLNLTVRDFAEKLGVQGSAISLIENGKRALTNQMIHSICCEYNINEEWLRFGKGKMKRSPDEFSLDEYAKSKGATDEEIILAKAYFSIDPEIRKTFLEQLQQAYDEQHKNEDTGSEDTVIENKPLSECSEEEIHKRFAEMEKAAIKEKRRESHQSDIIDSKKA